MFTPEGKFLVKAFVRPQAANFALVRIGASRSIPAPEPQRAVEMTLTVFHRSEYLLGFPSRRISHGNKAARDRYRTLRSRYREICLSQAFTDFSADASLFNRVHTRARWCVQIEINSPAGEVQRSAAGLVNAARPRGGLTPLTALGLR